VDQHHHPAVVGYVRRTLLDPEYTIICTNGAFDIPRLCNLVSLDMREIMASIKDTMLAAQLLCPDLPKGLERRAAVLDLTRGRTRPMTTCLPTTPGRLRHPLS